MAESGHKLTILKCNDYLLTDKPLQTTVDFFITNKVTPYHQSFFHSPTDAQVNCLKNNFKIYIKIDIKIAPTCFGVITVTTERIIRAC
jgi:hypothetical protein